MIDDKEIPRARTRRGVFYFRDVLKTFHDTGAQGHAMGFNYNGKLRSAELLIRESGKVEMIRRAETLDDYFTTLNFPEARLTLNH